MPELVDVAGAANAAAVQAAGANATATLTDPAPAAAAPGTDGQPGTQSSPQDKDAKAQRYLNMTERQRREKAEARIAELEAIKAK